MHPDVRDYLHGTPGTFWGGVGQAEQEIYQPKSPATPPRQPNVTHPPVVSRVRPQESKAQVAARWPHTRENRQKDHEDLIGLLLSIAAGASVAATVFSSAAANGGLWAAGSGLVVAFVAFRMLTGPWRAVLTALRWTIKIVTVTGLILASLWILARLAG